MSAKIPHEYRLDDIRRILIETARARATVSYGEMARRLGIGARGPWKPVLDMLARQEISTDRPDLTHLLVNKKTGVSSYLEWQPTATPPTSSQRTQWKTIVHEIWTYYERIE